ncbi:uncharacterized protein LOC144242666 isoform X1 [Crocuta crocuta]
MRDAEKTEPKWVVGGWKSFGGVNVVSNQNSVFQETQRMQRENDPWASQLFPEHSDAFSTKPSSILLDHLVLLSNPDFLKMWSADHLHQNDSDAYETWRFTAPPASHRNRIPVLGAHESLRRQLG